MLILKLSYIFFLFVEVDHCFHNPCKNNGTCTSRPDNYTCDCWGPYEGLNCEGNQVTFTLISFLNFSSFRNKKVLSFIVYLAQKNCLKSLERYSPLVLLVSTVSKQHGLKFLRRGKKVKAKRKGPAKRQRDKQEQLLAEEH